MILTAHIGDSDVSEALQLGARGVLMKHAATELLFKSIHMVMAGQYWVGRDSVADLIEKLRERRAAPVAMPSDPVFGLTPRELEMVAAVVAGCSNSDIADKLAISSKTVKHHLTNIFDKLGLSNRLELALFAVQHRFESGTLQLTLPEWPLVPRANHNSVENDCDLGRTSIGPSGHSHPRGPPVSFIHSTRQIELRGGSRSKWL